MTAPASQFLLKVVDATTCKAESSAPPPPQNSQPVETHQHTRQDVRVRDHLDQLFRFAGQHVFRVCFEAQDELTFQLCLRDAGRRKCGRFGIGTMVTSRRKLGRTVIYGGER